MAKLIIFVCSFVLLSVFCESKSSEYVSYNSSDLSYLSNGIQFPVPESSGDDPVVEMLRVENGSEMAWIRKLYDHHDWTDRLARITDEKCQKDMNVYIGALKNGTSWAAKMHDASGRYNSQFFYGNDYWLGSSFLCAELADPDVSAVIPPFPVNFYVAKVRMNINEILTPVTRQLNVGQCLPKSCKSSDVRLLFIQEKSLATSLNVIDVRSVPGDYSLLTDTKFYILASVTVIVTGLIVTATIANVIKKCGRITNENCENNNNNNVEDDKSHSKTNAVHRSKNGKVVEILLCFCFMSNAKKILAVDRVPDDCIKCIHGLRVFSIAWIILVHTYLEVFAIADNKTYRNLTERSFLYQTVSNATFSVDTFFFISGLLVTIIFLRSSEKKIETSEDKQPNHSIKKSVIKFFILVLYRFLRLTPAYLYVLVANELVLRYAHNNSVFSPAMIDHLTCDAYWWRNVLYINNFFPQSEFCMLWSWYISNDSQFYVLSVIILLIAVRGGKCFNWAVASVIVFMLTSWITTFIIAMKYNYVARVEEPFALFDQLYDKPWLRVGPYLVGIAVGYFLFRVKTKITLTPILVSLGWIFSMGILLSLVYGLGRQGLVTPLSAVYAAFGHTAWGLALAWITIACCWGYGGPIEFLLTFRGFLPLSRLTYCAYLLHPVIMVYTSFKPDGPMHMHNLIMLIVFLGNLVASFILAFLVSIAFETPVVGLLKIILMPSSKDK